MFVVGFGTYDTRRHPRSGIILRGLRELGVKVVEFNEPLNISTAERVEILRKPWLIYKLILSIFRSWRMLTIERMRWLGRNFLQRAESSAVDAVLVGYMGHFDVLLARLLFPNTVIALDMLIFAHDTALDRGTTSKSELRLLRLLDNAAMRIPSLIVTDTEENASLVPDRFREKVVVIPVGVNHEWQARRLRTLARATEVRPKLSIVFYGLFTPLQGAETIATAVSSLSDVPIEVTIIGTGQDYAKARHVAHESHNITWIDWVDPVELPYLVAQFDVCLGIFGDTAKARRVVPNKVYQGAAAGCAIVTSDTQPQRRALGDCAIYVPPGDAGALEQALRDLLARPDEVIRLQRLASLRAREAFAPAQVAYRLLTALAGDPIGG